MLTSAAWLLLVGCSFAGSAIAADPSQIPSATARPPTCAERYPVEGPAGLDLRLGCTVSELVGLYSRGADPAVAPRISTWLGPIGLVVGGLAVASIGLRWVGRRAGARLAPTTPGAWWQCPSCRSLNPEGTTSCYHCGTARPESPADA